MVNLLQKISRVLLIAQFHRGNFRVQQIGNGENVVVQIAQ